VPALVKTANIRFLPITPPLRGSRQDEGASPKSRRWGEHLKRLPRPAAQENRKGRGAAYPHRERGCGLCGRRGRRGRRGQGAAGAVAVPHPAIPAQAGIQ